MTHVLAVTALELSDPVPFLVLVEADDTPLHAPPPPCPNRLRPVMADLVQ
jgi:hypothetical protein